MGKIVTDEDDEVEKFKLNSSRWATRHVVPLTFNFSVLFLHQNCKTAPHEKFPSLSRFKNSLHTNYFNLLDTTNSTCTLLYTISYKI